MIIFVNFLDDWEAKFPFFFMCLVEVRDLKPTTDWQILGFFFRDWLTSFPALFHDRNFFSDTDWQNSWFFDANKRQSSRYSFALWLIDKIFDDPLWNFGYFFTTDWEKFIRCFNDWLAKSSIFCCKWMIIRDFFFQWFQYSSAID